MKLTVTQKNPDGFLGGPRNLQFDLQINQQTYEIEISQCGQRSVSVSSSANYGDILHVFYDIETLLMLFDGQFFQTIEANDGASITLSWRKRSLPCFESADFLIGSSSKLIEYDSLLSPPILEKWDAMRQELDIIHNTVLYSTSNAGVPIDMKCAFMIEAFEGLSELLQVHDPNYARPTVPKGVSKLGKYLLSVIDCYGSDIFTNEFQADRDKFSQILVNSRNRIAHIKSRQGRTYLDGEESMEMTRKLFTLYRVTLFNLLGIPRSQYNIRLNSYVSSIDNAQSMIAFFNKLQDPAITA